MYLLEYTPQALHDLQTIKAYIEENFGISVASGKIKKLTSTICQLELFPYSRPPLHDLILFGISNSSDSDSYWKES